MKRMSGILSYDGTNFSGYQVQPDQRTVQGELEQVLQRMHKGQIVKTTASGRTDTGVHAMGQVFHFDTPLSIEPDGWKRALNTLLPSDIRLVSIQEVSPDFHARFDVDAKEYRYRILRSLDEDVFRRNQTYHYPYPLDVGNMRTAALELIGEHDFTSFCSAKTEVADKVRKIFELELIESGDELILRIKGNGFLYNMVRIIVGTLLEIGNGHRPPDEVVEILEAKDRDAAGKTAPGHGLYLWKVFYKKDE
ncbi:tRNA pseudouridine(38-40) synthase TruA [Pseudalkalibacillus sp. SCS-8]|uniref:tRNA pseudouridine(38-40) synthase TruA n=1 Tax=Pseudalkalibacillus nanhaiensis TaxID=3115291 RepID=UPI0032DAFEFC